MVASLPMYQREELEQAHADYWRLIAGRLGHDFALTTSGDEADLWLHPDLVLSQTCGMPYRLHLHDKVALIATPDYGTPGCPPGYYRSAIIVGRDDSRRKPTDFKDALFAYNAEISQSGYAAAYSDCLKHGFFFKNKTCSGSHLNSAKMVAKGQADIAYIDPVSLSYMEEFDSFYNDLRILGWTDPTPGLPYISALDSDVDAIFNAIANTIAELPEKTRKQLRLKGITYIPKQDYLAVPSIY